MEHITTNPFSILENRLSAIEQTLNDLRIDQLSQTSINKEDEIGNMALAIKITGLAKPTIYSLVENDKIPFMKRGKRLYFSRLELTDWIKTGRPNTIVQNKKGTHSILKIKKVRKSGLNKNY